MSTPASLLPLHDGMFRARDSAIERNLTAAPMPPPAWGEDILRIAKAVHLADKLSLRAESPDRWTRTIDLSVQLVDRAPWQGRTESVLASLLEILTSDRWNLRFHEGAAQHPGVQPALLDDGPAEEVALFSGGLDSTAYAAERVQLTGSASPLLLISYFDPPLRAPQLKALDAVKRLSTRRVYDQPVLQHTRADGARLEQSSRSRGLLYLCTAIYAAAAHRAKRVAIPENGQLAINPPLTAARVGAASTRSVHPYLLHLVNQIVEIVGGDVRITNPLLADTKGQVCRRARDAGLALTTLAETISCGRSPLLYGRGNVPHCGHCYPCLVRQSGLLAGAGHDDTPYKIQVWDLPPDAEESIDRRALAAWLAQGFGIRDLTSDLPLPPQTDAHALLGTLMRGRDELQELFALHTPAGS